MTRLFLAVALAAATAATVIAGQNPALHSGVHTVSVYASVVDSTGRLVTGLTKDDFVVLDDGKPQDVSVFTTDIEPITIVMMLDRSGSVTQQYLHVRDAAEQFVGALGPDDRARIGSFSAGVRIDPEVFTSDKDELVRILHENLQGPGPTPLWNAANSAIAALRGEPGRRVVLIFTDGYDNPLNSNIKTTLEDVRARSRADEVMLYGIGLAIECAPAPRVTTALRSIASSAQPLFQRGGRGGPVGRGGGRGPGVIPQGPRLPGGAGIPRLPLPIPQRPPVVPRGPGTGGIDPRGGDPHAKPVPNGKADGPCEVTEPDPGLRELALDSGGGYFELHAADELTHSFARVADELHRQYLIGFTPQTLDGRTHRLEVQLRDTSLTVRARRTYVASAR